MRVLIENPVEGNEAWVTLPNGDIKTAISDVMGESLTWVAIKLECELEDNWFLSCNLIDFNELILELEEHYNFDVNDIKNLSVLNMLLVDRHFNIEEVGDIMFNETYHIHNVESSAELAEKFLSNTTTWYDDFDTDNLLQYFDFDAYGEQMLKDDIYLIDSENKIFLELL